MAYPFSMPLRLVTIAGNTSKRTVGHFGLRYDYGSRVLRDRTRIPAELEPQIRHAEEFAGLANGTIDEALVNRYPPGASVGWHSDAAVYRTIVGISLRASCKIRFRDQGYR